MNNIPRSHLLRKAHEFSFVYFIWKVLENSNIPWIKNIIDDDHRKYIF